MIELLTPICAKISTLDLSDPSSAKASLERAFPDLSSFREAILSRTDLTPKQAGESVRFGRIAKPSPTTFNLSIDAVEMSGAAAAHTHPNGEVSLCFAVEGNPEFFGCTEGWVVVEPGSRHIPTVTGGTMRILYFLPDGAMVWH